MSAFDLGEQTYIALTRPEDLTGLPDYPIHAAVYAPGLACADYGDHRDGAALLHYAYLVPRSLHWWHASDAVGPPVLLGATCARGHHRDAQPGLWRTALDNRHPLAGTGLADDWRDRTKRRYWRIVPLLGLMIQVEPRESTRGLLLGYLRRITREKDDLTKKQKWTLLDILRERGADPMDDWSKELKAHYKELKRRRDLAFRLARLRELELAPEDAKIVSDLREDNTAWSRGRMRRLTKDQKRLIRALEAQHLKQRVAATEALAWRLATRLGETETLDQRRKINGTT
jgi:hypothetical protein